MASRTLFFLGLLVASFCATANAGRVTPTETMKVAGFLPACEFELVLTVDLLAVAPTEHVVLIVQDAVGNPAVFELVGGVVTRLQAITVHLALATSPLTITIEVFDVERELELPLAALDPALGPLAAITGPVSVALALVQETVKGGTVMTVLNTVRDTIGTITAARTP